MLFLILYLKLGWSNFSFLRSAVISAFSFIALLCIESAAPKAFFCVLRFYIPSVMLEDDSLNLSLSQNLLLNNKAPTLSVDSIFSMLIV